jgi:UDP-glucose 4-epimerase
MSDVDTVFHLAAKARVQPSIDDPMTFNKANVDSTLNVLVASRDIGVKKFIYSASSSCYGDTEVVPTPETAPINPVSPYGLQKYIGEEYCKLFSQIYDLDTVCLRYFNIYGPGMSHDGAYSLVLSVWKNQFDNGKSLTVTNDGKQKRDFTHVDDVIQANMLAAISDKKLKGEAFNVGTGKSFSMNEVVSMIGHPFVYGEKRLEPFETLADNSKIRNQLGWSPTQELKTFIEKNFK